MNYVEPDGSIVKGSTLTPGPNGGGGNENGIDGTE